MKGISVYIISPSSREKLLKAFPPQYKTFVGHHVTYKFGASDKDSLAPEGQYHVIGISDIADNDSDGLEALIVSIKLPHKSRGHTTRADGNTFHITWSHGPSYSAKDSKELTSLGFKKVNPIEINMEPTFIPFQK